MIQGILKGLAASGKTLMKNSTEIAVKHAPAILMGIGTVSVTSGLIWGFRAGRASVIVQEQAEMDKAEEERKALIRSGEYEKGGKETLMLPLTWQEKVRTLAPLYIPPVGLVLFGLGCFWSAQGINMKRQAVLAGLYATSQESLQEYQRKVIELMGEKKHEDIQDAIAEDKEKQMQPLAAVPNLGVTDITCNLYGELFQSSYAKIKAVQNEFNEEMIGELDSCKTVAELKWKLDPNGDFLTVRQEDFESGWSVDRPLILHVANPYGPIATITYVDKYNVDNLPQPKFRCT